MLESVNNRFQYKKLTEQEMQERLILGTLVGPCADIVDGTRNGRKYSERLWEKVFDSPLIKEQFNAGAIFGELEHPDYDLVNPEKIAIAMPEPPKKGKDGLLYGYWHILNTPCGKILKTLVDYGYKPGISSRGNGEVIEDYNGEESVDPDTYQLNAFDVVLIPAVEKARLVPVTESLDTKKKQLNESLKKIVSDETEEHKKIMNEALALLNISIDEQTTTPEDEDNTTKTAVVVDVTTDESGIVISEPKEEEIDLDAIQTEVTITPEITNDIVDSLDASETGDDINSNSEVEKAVDDGLDVFVDLKDAYDKIEELNKQNESLKSEISVGHAKEQELNEKLKVYKEKIVSLVENNKKITGLTARTTKLEESSKIVSEKLDIADRDNKSLQRIVNLQKTNIQQLENLNNRHKDTITKYKTLVESLKAKNKTLIDESTVKDNKASEQLDLLKESYDKDLEKLSEDYNSKLNDLEEQNKKLKQKAIMYSNKLEKMTEAYLKNSCDFYDLDSKRILKEVKEFDPEEIDRITESFSQRKLSERKLPFQVSNIKNIGYNGPKDKILTDRKVASYDDDIDINEANTYDYYD